MAAPLVYATALNVCDDILTASKKAKLAATVTSSTLASEHVTDTSSTVTGPTSSTLSTHEPHFTVSSYAHSTQPWSQYLATRGLRVTRQSLSGSILSTDSNGITDSVAATGSEVVFGSDYFAVNMTNSSKTLAAIGMVEKTHGSEAGIGAVSDMSGLPGELKLSDGNVVDAGSDTNLTMATRAAMDSLNTEAMEKTAAVLKSQVVADQGALEMCPGGLKFSSGTNNCAVSSKHGDNSAPSSITEMSFDSVSDASDGEDCQSSDVISTFALLPMMSSPNAEQRQSAVAATATTGSLLTSTVTREGNSNSLLTSAVMRSGCADTLMTSTVTRPSYGDMLLTSTVTRPSYADSLRMQPASSVLDSPATQASGMTIKVELNVYSS